jgi:hypothetical protein
LSGDESTSESEAKKHGRRFPNVPSSLRSFKIPCSGRTLPVPHFCTNCQIGSGWCGIIGLYRPTDSTENDGVGRLGCFERLVRQRVVVRVYRTLEDVNTGSLRHTLKLTPPNRCSLKLKVLSVCFCTTLRIFSASATT